jgi:hypothetical protein
VFKIFDKNSIIYKRVDVEFDSQLGI